MSRPREHNHESTVDASFAGVRLDKYIAEALNLFSRSQIQHRNLSARVNGKAVKLSSRVVEGDLVQLTFDEPAASEITPEDIPLDILYEDEDVVVINKPAGMVVHPAAGHWSGTVVQALMYHISGLRGRFDDPVRPGIVHRLDRDTTGVLIAAKHPAAVELLARQFKARTAKKTYIAMVKGQMNSTRGVFEGALARDPNNRKRYAVVNPGGKEAVTEYRLLHQAADFALVELRPRTGRTHQLRVHLSHDGHPIIGDPVYGRKSGPFAGLPLMLHAATLEISLPSGEPASFHAPLPQPFLTVWPTDLPLP